MSGEKPLNVRCAEAIGCKPVRSAMLRWYCACHVNFAPHRTIATGPSAGELAPYGENTPEGLACTMGFIERYGLCVLPEVGWWACCKADDTDADSARGSHPCASVAEWVAKHVENGEVRRG